MRKNRLIIPALLTFLSLQGYAQELNDSITSVNRQNIPMKL